MSGGAMTLPELFLCQHRRSTAVLAGAHAATVRSRAPKSHLPTFYVGLKRGQRVSEIRNS